MTTKPGTIGPGLGLGAATFLAVMAMPYDNAPALWWTMAGLCGLAMLLAILAARSGTPLGTLSVAIVSVIALSAVTGLAAPVAGIDPADYPLTFGLFLVVIIGFPLGVLALSYPFMAPLPAFLSGVCGVIYLPLPLWLSVELGVNGYMIDVFDPRLELGRLLGVESIGMGTLANLLGMCLASGATLLVLILPALPVMMIVRTWIDRS